MGSNEIDKEILYFGWCANHGHDLRSKKRRIDVYRDTPWGHKLDGGLLTDDYYRADNTPTGKISEHHKDGWTVISFWDRSGDKRPGSNTAFLFKPTCPLLT